MVAAWVSAVATAIATVNGLLQWRHRREDNRRFREVHDRITNGSAE
jgi:hypothetical protein